MAVFVNKVTRKVIELVDADDITQDDVLAPYVQWEMLPEGVNAVQVSMNYHKLNTVSINEWNDVYERAEGVEADEALLIYDHSGISISATATTGGWDTTTVGYIKVKADTVELAQKHLEDTVQAWDNYYRYGVTDARLYDSIVEHAQGKPCNDVASVDAGSLDQEQAIEAATYFNVLGNEGDWVRMSELDDAVVLAELRSLINIPEPERASDVQNGDLLDAARTLLDALK